MRRERCAEVLEEISQTVDIRSRVVFRADELSRKLAQHVKRFVRQSRTTNNADRISSVIIRDFIETLSNVPDRFIPRRGNQLAALLITNQRRANARLVIDEWMSESSLNAEELAIDAVDIPIARD